MATKSSFSNPGPGIAARGPVYGIPGEKVDGNDVFAVYEVARRAVERARTGDGPSLIETETYRFKGHTIHDQAAYRSKAEVAEWLKRDPIERFRDVVVKAKALRAKDLQAIDAEVDEEVKAAVEFAEASPWPSLDVLETDVYADSTWS